MRVGRAPRSDEWWAQHQASRASFIAVDPENCRRFAHIALGILAATLSSFLDRAQIIILAGTVMVLLAIHGRRRRVVRSSRDDLTRGLGSRRSFHVCVRGRAFGPAL